MKKILLFSSICLLPSYILHAQITIGQWDVVMPGKVVYQAHDTIPGSINPGPAGANQTWSFSTLSADVTDTLTFTNPNWLPNGSGFPNSNLAFIGNDGTENYLRNDASGFYIEGFYGDPFQTGYNMEIVFSDSRKVAQWYDMYGNSFTDTGVASGTFAVSLPPPFTSIDSARLKHIEMVTQVTDAWGNITTPLGTYPSLRHRAKVLTIDSLWMRDSTAGGWFDVTGAFVPERDSSVHFSWWTTNVGFPLLEFDSNAVDSMVTNISFLPSLPVVGAVNDASTTLNMTIAYPNPTSDMITFEFKTTDAASVEVFDLFGNKIASLPANRNNKIVFNTQPLSAGTYLYRSVNAGGTMQGKGRFEVVR